MAEGMQAQVEERESIPCTAVSLNEAALFRTVRGCDCRVQSSNARCLGGGVENGRFPSSTVVCSASDVCGARRGEVQRLPREEGGRWRDA